MVREGAVKSSTAAVKSSTAAVKSSTGAVKVKEVINKNLL
jgi:hypothetical protein